MSSPAALAVCQSGFDALLVRELPTLGLGTSASGPGWAAVTGPESALAGSAFTHWFLQAPVVFAGDRVNALAQALFDFFAASLAGERIAASWPCVFAGPVELTGLGRRMAAVEAAFHELLRRKLGRLAKLATPVRPRLGPARGLFVWFSDFGILHAARAATMNGPSRMADDEAAPSRSYLKLEEAYGVIGIEPAPGEVVCDLGAAPGGWSYSAAKRGARVVAVDNGPLKGGALGHPRIEHRQDDAFGFSPGTSRVFDWLLADLIEDPHKILRSVVIPWLQGGWCRRFVVNLKFGRVDPVALLQELRAPAGILATHASGVRILHLYHDREEFTVTGSRAP
jgi:23S rRNA (cytidine2498-2'-O)-methyltransferase